MKHSIIKCALVAALTMINVNGLFTEEAMAKPISYSEQKKYSFTEDLKEINKEREAIAKEIAKVEKSLKQGKITKKQAEKKIAKLEKEDAALVEKQEKIFDNIDDYKLTKNELKKLAAEIEKRENAIEKQIKAAEQDYKNGKITKTELREIKKQAEADKLELEAYKLKVMNEEWKDYTGNEKELIKKILDLKKRELELEQSEKMLEADFRAGKLTVTEYHKAKKALDKADDQLEWEEKQLERKYADYDRIEDMLDFDDDLDDRYDDWDDDDDDDDDWDDDDEYDD